MFWPKKVCSHDGRISHVLSFFHHHGAFPLFCRADIGECHGVKYFYYDQNLAEMASGRL